MQKILLVDYLDGTRRAPAHERGLSNLAKFIKFAEKEDFNSPQVRIQLEREFVTNPGLAEFIGVYGSVLKNGGKNYVFSEYLSDCLKNTLSDVSMKYLPNEFSGFIDLPNLNLAESVMSLGLFVDISQEQGKRRMRVAALGRLPDGDVSWPSGLFDLSEDADKTLFECFLERAATYTKHSYLPPNRDDPNWVWIEVAVNAVVFIANCTEELLEKCNEFATKRSKREWEQNQFTQKKFFYADLKKKIEFVVDSTFVKGFLFWQKYGPGHSKVRLRYRKPHKRVYKKKDHGINDPL